MTQKFDIMREDAALAAPANDFDVDEIERTRLHGLGLCATCRGAGVDARGVAIAPHLAHLYPAASCACPECGARPTGEARAVRK